MVNPHIQQLLSEGDSMLEFARRELERASEDVVTFLACNNIKRGINFYLQAYIESNRLNIPLHPTPDNLLRLCIGIDPQFSTLDFHPLECSSEKGANNYCTDVGHVRECLDLAESTQQLVLQRLVT